MLFLSEHWLLHSVGKEYITLIIIQDLKARLFGFYTRIFYVQHQAVYRYIYKQSIEYRNCLQKIITFRSVIPLTIIQKL